MDNEELRKQVDSLIRDEIQEVINEYVDTQDESGKTGLGFVKSDDEKELKVNIAKKEVDKLIKEYKKIKKSQRSNIGQVKKLGLVDKYGKPL